MKASIPFEDYLMPKLKDPRYADEYIDIALETYDEDQNLDALLLILQSVVLVQDEDKKVTEKIYWALKERGILPMLKKSSRPATSTLWSISVFLIRRSRSIHRHRTNLP